MPILIFLVVMYNFWIAIATLYPRGMTTHLIFNQLIMIGIAVFLGVCVYWSILIYYVYLMQENEVLVQDNFSKLAGSGTLHLQNAKGLISKLLEDIKASEAKMKIR